MKKISAVLVCALVFMSVLTGCGVHIFDKNISFGIGSRYSYDKAKEYTGSSDFSIDTGVKSITEIDIEWVAGDVTVKVTDSDKLRVFETGASNDDDKMRYRVNNGSLDIKWRAKGRFNSNLKKSVTIEIPEALMGKLKFDADLVSAEIKAEGLQFTELSVDTVSGNATFTDCSAEKILIESVSGDVDLAECTVDEISIESVSGDIRAGRVFKKGDIETVSGRVILKCTETLDELDISTVSGNVDLVTVAKPRRVDVETLSGDIHYYGENKGKKDFSDTNADGVGEINVETVSGDIDFDIAQ